MGGKDKVKLNGEVFTPRYIVNIMLGLSDYEGTKILKKHVIDNSSGTGMFLERIVEKYVEAYYDKYGTYNGLKKDLEKYIHGIELNPDSVAKSIERLNVMLKSNYNIDSIGRDYKSKVKWDIRCADTLEVCDEYNGKMDYVFANPPYVRIHNIPDFNKSLLHSFSFAKNGMSDLYLAFYEVGFRMLSDTGKMCYISPNSWFKSVAGREMRNYIFESGEVTLRSLIDFKHFQPFNGITTYVSVALFDKASNKDYSLFEIGDDGMSVLRNPYLEIRVSDHYNEVSIVSSNDVVIPDTNRSDNLIKVKNGFATLADKFFINEKGTIPYTELSIDVIKAQTNEWHKCIFPYKKKDYPDYSYDPLTEEELQLYYPTVYDYMVSNYELLYNRSIPDPENNWFLFGRTQAINDTDEYKISIQSLIKDKDSIKMSLVKPGQGVYGGLYIISADENIPTEKLYEWLEKNIRSDKFVNYVKSLRHYKSGGYYTFTSKELENYINFMVYNKKKEDA